MRRTVYVSSLVFPWALYPYIFRQPPGRAPDKRGNMTLIYRAIVLVVLALVLRCLFRERDFWKQVTAALVVIPLVLRALMIK